MFKMKKRYKKSKKQKIKEQMRKDAEIEHYKKEWKKKIKKSRRYTLAVKVNLDLRNKIIQECDKRKVSISTFIKNAVVRGLCPVIIK